MYVESEEYKKDLAKLQRNYEELETNFSKANQQLLDEENHFQNKFNKLKSRFEQLSADLSSKNSLHEREVIILSFKIVSRDIILSITIFR